MQKINSIGLWTLYSKEVKRFLKVYNQTLIAPIVSALIFLAIFALALGKHVKSLHGINFAEFVGVGLIIMSLIQNAFANTTSVLIAAKMNGTIIDYLMPPLSSNEILLAVVGGGVTRGLMVGLLVGLAVSCFTNLHIHHFGYVLFFAIGAAILLALLGTLSGIITNTFEQMSIINSYVIVPLSFLSGTFYSTTDLPNYLQTITHFNPFFYLIDGFRYGMLGHHDSNLTIGIIATITAIIVLWTAVYVAFKTGWRLKS
jgi:ABC-2 type transport system permease protein